jgi:ABC-type amino acid transport substrate-binding protein
VRTDAPSRLREVLSGRPAPFQPQWRASVAAALQLRTFSAITGTTAEAWLRERRSTLEIQAEIAPVDGYEAGVQRVLSRKSDALFGDRPILLDAANHGASSGELVVVDRQFSYEPLALALRRGDDDFRLVVDRALSGVYRSGEIERIYEIWFGEPDEIALNFFRLNALPE